MRVAKSCVLYCSSKSRGPSAQSRLPSVNEASVAECASKELELETDTNEASSSPNLDSTQATETHVSPIHRAWKNAPLGSHSVPQGRQPMQQASLANQASPSYTSPSTGWNLPAQQPYYDSRFQPQPSVHTGPFPSGSTQPDQQPSYNASGQPGPFVGPSQPPTGRQPTQQTNYGNQASPNYSSPSAGWHLPAQQAYYDIRFQSPTSGHATPIQSASTQPNQQPSYDASGQPQPSTEPIPPPAGLNSSWKQPFQQHDARVLPQPSMQYAPPPTGWQPQIAGQAYGHYMLPPGAFQPQGTVLPPQAATTQQQPPGSNLGWKQPSYDTMVQSQSSMSPEAANTQQQAPGSNFGWKQPVQQPPRDTIIESESFVQYRPPPPGWQHQNLGQPYVHYRPPQTAFQPPLTASPPQATTPQQQRPPGSPGWQQQTHGQPHIYHTRPSTDFRPPLTTSHSEAPAMQQQPPLGYTGWQQQTIGQAQIYHTLPPTAFQSPSPSSPPEATTMQRQPPLGSPGLNYENKVEELFKQNKLEEIDGVYSQMKASQVHVSAKTYGTIMQSYLQLGKMDKVTKIYQEMSGVLFSESKERDEKVEVTSTTSSIESSTVSTGPPISAQDAQVKAKKREDEEHMVSEKMAFTWSPTIVEDAQPERKNKEDGDHVVSKTTSSPPLDTGRKSFSLFGQSVPSLGRGLGRGMEKESGPSESRVGTGRGRGKKVEAEVISTIGSVERSMVSTWPPTSGQDAQIKTPKKEDGEHMGSQMMGFTWPPSTVEDAQLKRKNKEDRDYMISETIGSPPLDTESKSFPLFEHSVPSSGTGMGRGVEKETKIGMGRGREKDVEVEVTSTTGSFASSMVYTGPPTSRQDARMKTKDEEDGVHMVSERMAFTRSPITVDDAQLKKKNKEDGDRLMSEAISSPALDTAMKNISLFGNSVPSVGRGMGRELGKETVPSEPRVGTGRGRGKVESFFNFNFSEGLRSADEQVGGFAKLTMQGDSESKTEVQDEYSQTFTPVIQPGWYAFAPEGLVVGPGAGRGRIQSPQIGSMGLDSSPAERFDQGSHAYDPGAPAVHQQRPPLYALDSRSRRPVEPQYADAEEEEPFQSTVSAEEAEAAAEQAMKILNDRRISRFKNMFEFDDNVVKRSPLGLARSLGERKQPKKAEEVGKAIHLTKEEEKKKAERLKAIKENEALQELHHTFDQFMKFYGEMAVEPEHELGDFTNPDIEEKPFMSLEEYLEKAKPNLMKTGLISSEKEWEDMVKDTMRHLPYYEEFVEIYGGPGRYTAKQENDDLEEIAGTLPSDVGRAAKSFVQRSLTTLKINPGLNLQQKQYMLASMVDEFSQYIVND